MQRSRKMAVLAHCLLNANCRAEGLARWEGIHPLVVELAERGMGVLQLPCPEMGIGGCDRPTRTRGEYDTDGFRAHCEQLADGIAYQVAEFQGCGVEVFAVVGVEGSPSCALTRDEPGIFVETLRSRLGPLGVEFFALDTRDEAGSIAGVLAAAGSDGPGDVVS